MSIGMIIVGLLLLFFHLITIYVLFNNFRKLIVCTVKTCGRVVSVTSKEKRHEDSKTGKTTYYTEYTVQYEYEYNGQRYLNKMFYNDHCIYSNGDSFDIKINPRKPEDVFMRKDIKNIVILILFLGLLGFFDLMYYASLY